MPRQPRLDVPGLVHHVIARCVEGTELFRDDEDRRRFAVRLGEVVSEGRADLLAWSLMANHVHLLLRPGPRPLSWIMRRLLTGHAVRFNLRHGRSGPLFRGRYKSLVVEEDPYLLELVRYVHLNPVRAGVFGTMGDLDRYPYTGHSAIVGAVPRSWQATGSVLALFSDDPAQAARLYRYFLAAAFDQGGGELALADREGGRRGRVREAQEDQRVLGGPRFTQEVHAQTAKTHAEARRAVEEVLGEVCEASGLSAAELLGEGRTRPVARVRREFFLRAVEECGASCAALGRLCRRSHVAVLRAVEKARREKYEN